MRGILVLSILFSILIANLSEAQWQPSMHGYGSAGRIAADSSGNRLIVIMQDGLGVWLTNDAGQNWEKLNRQINGSPVIRTVAYTDIEAVGAAADTLVITVSSQGYDFESGEFHSFDGGQTWSSFSDLVQQFWPDSIEAWSADERVTVFPNRAYYSLNGGFGISPDGGTTWNVIDISGLHPGLHDALFDEARPDTVYLCGKWGLNQDQTEIVGGVIGTFDGGITWHGLTDMPELSGTQSGDITAIDRGAGSHLYAVTYWLANGTIYPPLMHSTDNGTTWSFTDSEGLPGLMQTRHLLAIPEQPGRVLVAGHYEAGVWESDDHGSTWHRLLNGLPEQPGAVLDMFRNRYSGDLYITFAGQRIWKSVDAGENWQEVSPPPVAMSSHNYYGIGLIAGEGGMLHGYRNNPLWFTPDDATTFQPIPSLNTDQNDWIVSYAFAYPVDTLIVGQQLRDIQTGEINHSVLRSNDDGSTWTQYQHDFTGTSITVPVETDSGLVLVGTSYTPEGNWHWSTDLGQTWEHALIDIEVSYGLSAVGTTLIAGRQYEGERDLVKSDDLGQTWTSLAFPQPDDLYVTLTPVLALNDTLLFRIADHCWAYFPDGTWEQRGEIFTSGYHAITYDWVVLPYPDNPEILCGTDADTTLAVSQDGSWTWEYHDIDLPGRSGERTMELEYDRWRQRLWIDTGQALAYRELTTGIFDDTVLTFQPATYTMLQAYPNPFNASVTIRYTLSSPGPVAIGIFDVLGREVTRLADEQISDAGVHLVSFDASNAGLSSGNYFIRLSCGSETVQRKVVLIK